MSDTKSRLVIPAKTWVNLNTEYSIATGVEMTVHNVGNSEIFLSTSATQPTDLGLPIRQYGQATNQAGDNDAWCYSINGSVVIVE